MAVSDVPTDALPAVVQTAMGEVLNVIKPILEWLSLLLGGLFGLYILYFLVKLYFDRKRIKILREVKDDVEYLKEHSLTEDELERLRHLLKSKTRIRKKTVATKNVKKSPAKKKIAKPKKQQASKKKTVIKKQVSKKQKLKK